MELVYSKEPAIQGGHVLNALLKAHNTKPVLLLLSGGSAFSLLSFIEVSLLGPHITLGVLDERFSPDPTVNNFSQLSQTDFFKDALQRGVQSIDTDVHPGESSSALAHRLEQTLRGWFDTHTKGVAIATMGIGSDGHTAGIFPHLWDESFKDDQWILSYSLPPDVTPYTERITTTPTFLREMISHALVFVQGMSKEATLQKLIQSGKAGDPSLFPAYLFYQMQSVTLVTDIPIEHLATKEPSQV